jgi:chaperone required for assembly of F1-ATPase
MPTIPNLQKLRRFYKKANVIEHPLSDKVLKLKSNEKVNLNNLSMSHDTYWAVTLDDRVTKTFFKDDLLIPSRSLAVALAEEWEA